MAVHTIDKGLDLPIVGDPQQVISNGKPVRYAAVVAADYVGMKPRMLVKVGDAVKRGQALFEDRKCQGVVHTAPGAGRVHAIHRGEYRALITVVIELSTSEISGDAEQSEQCDFKTYSGKKPSELERAEVVDLLSESGLWTSLRARPFGRVPSPQDEAPYALFVTAADSQPHAPDVDVALKGQEEDFETGLVVLSKLSNSKVFLCKKAGSKVGGGSLPGLSIEEFAGPHPSGTVGLHIHTLAPVHRGRTVWTIGYQDVVAIGKLFSSGRLDVNRVVSLAGPGVLQPRLIRVRLGAFIDDIIDKELHPGENRVVSGSVLSGRIAMGETTGFLGRYHNQISVLQEGRERKLFGWLTLGREEYSTSGIYLSALNRKQKFAFTTSTQGSKRAMVPIGMYERVFPFDILPTFLLRAILMKDFPRAEELGVLELDAEDMDLCTFVCPGKHDYGAILRENLEQIRSEG